MNFLKTILISLLFLIAPALAFAQAPATAPSSSIGQNNSVKSLLNAAGNAAKYETSDVKGPTEIVGGIIQIVLSFLGVIFIVLMIHGGFLWMTARGNEDQVGKAQTIIKNAVIGLIVVVSAYAITYFVLASLTRGYITTSGF